MATDTKKYTKKSRDYETVKNFTKDPPEGGYEPTTDGGIEDVKWMHKGWSPSIRE